MSARDLPAFDLDALAAIADACPEAVARAAMPTDAWLSRHAKRLDDESAAAPALWWPPNVEPFDVDSAPGIVSTIAGATHWAVRDGRPGFSATIAAVRAVVEPDDMPRRSWAATYRWALDAFDAGAQIASADLLRVWDQCGTPRWPLDAPHSLEWALPAARAVRAGAVERRLAVVFDELGRAGATGARRRTLAIRVAELSQELAALVDLEAAA